MGLGMRLTDVGCDHCIFSHRVGLGSRPSVGPHQKKVSVVKPKFHTEALDNMFLLPQKKPPIPLRQPTATGGVALTRGGKTSRRRFYRK